MILNVTPSRIRGRFAVPGSKSHTIRGVVAGLLAEGVTELGNPLVSADTASVLAAAETLGARVEREAALWRITGTGGRFARPAGPLDLGNSGTGLRLLAAAAALADFPVAFDGDASLRTRVMTPLLSALANLGVGIESRGGKCPLSVQGPIRGGRTGVDAVSSQFLSALLFACPLAGGDTVIEVENLNEAPYVRITLDWLDAMGIRYRCGDDLMRFEIPGGQRIAGLKRRIPGDFSTAAFPLGAALLAGAEGEWIELEHLDFSDTQGDKAVFDYAAQLNAEIDFGSTVRVRRSARLRPATLDLNATPDALPLLAAVLATVDGESRLVNVPQARIKETDRIAVMTAELRRMGADIEELPDGMVIRGGRLHGARLDGHDDHRVVMALAVAALAAEGPSAIAGAEAAAVTYPGFFRDFQHAGANFKLEES